MTSTPVNEAAPGEDGTQACPRGRQRCEAFYGPARGQLGVFYRPKTAASNQGGADAVLVSGARGRAREQAEAR
jgi:hypothetical protein